MIARTTAAFFAFAVAIAPLAALADLYVNLTDLKLVSHVGNCGANGASKYRCTYKGELSLASIRSGSSSNCVVSFWPSDGGFGDLNWHYNFTKNNGCEASWTNANTLRVWVKPKAETCGKRC